MEMPHFLGTLMGKKPDALQVAALCLRRPDAETTKDVEVLLVSSLDTGRWIVPKGWPMRGKTLAEAALREAWEEAGVKGTVKHEPVGNYVYTKVRKTGLDQRCQVLCFIVDVEELEDKYPEAGRRKRKWVTPKAAAKRVQEKDLKLLLRTLS
ncbi:8-oxo-dGTP pyrophosphatase MutT (NUDIX family) [Rhodobacter aestuarii]|uniref:8-oxo-dGTP pyrophosphatase MutT, NUDIX family n=2 Tax=Rhodobacter aestuarii TaxID=453582 RepID=A0A1N7LP87_9RHOB|nr:MULTISPECIES: NUDIX hydrolase [Rhodobacter]PTV95122.1 8-oxo-dGTP pyrophosphatase MutT (NUDIX family) [Rhodobacter aestuarii]SIS75638.1 8-oxo-dGTP pyrophosphatase MutT, NUDIX family [Rhodobacter aestuarii]SOC07428.1 8-oxo-dGTP pyrophosphatase MutT (NUDIX family) [Rhodobacter sp. JA431]